MWRLSPTQIACALALVVGCGDDQAPAEADAATWDPFADHGHSDGCGDDHDHYQPGMARTTEAGGYRLRLTVTPDLGVGDRTLILAVRDADGAPIEGATVQIEVPGAIAVTDAVTDAAGEVSLPFALPSAGVWPLQIQVDGPAGLDVATLVWCL